MSQESGRFEKSEEFSSLLLGHIEAWDRGEPLSTTGLDEKQLEKLIRLRHAWESIKTGEVSAEASIISTIIAGYVVEREIGRGGFGVVYLARDRNDGRPVAIKQPLMQALLQESTRRRFLREGELAAGLDHPNIVPVFEIGESQGIPHIVSAYVEGSTLADWLSRQGKRPIPIDHAVSLLRQIASGIAHAHQRGILHRDLKPENILVDANGETPVITDFGLARALESDDSLSASHAIIGTASHMAPEQAAGRRNDVDVRSEVWSLGVILYRLLCGRLPFEGSNPTAILVEVMSGPVKGLRRIRHEIPHDLEAVCLKCLQIDRDKRYASVDRLIEDLDRQQRGEPTIARPRTRFQSARDWVKRRPVKALLVGLAMLLLLVGPAAGILFWDLRRDVEIAQFEKIRIAAAATREKEAGDFLASIFKIRERLEQRPAGWIKANLVDISKLASNPLFDKNAREIRNLWFKTLAAEEWRPIPWEVPTNHYDHIAVSPDNRLIAICETRQSSAKKFDTLIYDARTMRMISRFTFNGEELGEKHTQKGRDDGGRAMAFTHDGRFLYVSTRAGRVHVCDLASQKIVGNWKAIEDFIGDIEVSPDGEVVYVSGRYSNDLRAWSGVRWGELLAERKSPEGHGEVPLEQSIFLIGGKLLYCGGLEEPWPLDPKTLKPLPLPPTPPDVMRTTWKSFPQKHAFANSRDLLAAMGDSRLELVDSEHYVVGALLFDIHSRIGYDSHSGRPSISQDARHLAFSNIESVLLWDLSLGRSQQTFAASDAAVPTKFIPDPERLLILGKTPQAFQRFPSTSMESLAASPMRISQFEFVPGTGELLTLNNAENPSPNSRVFGWSGKRFENRRELSNDFTRRINSMMRVSPNGHTLLTGLNGRFLRRTPLNGQDEPAIDVGDYQRGFSQLLAFAPGNTTFWMMEKHRINLRSLADCSVISQAAYRKTDPNNLWYSCIVCTPNYLMAGRDDGIVDFFEADSGAFVRDQKLGESKITTLTHTADELWAGDTDGNIFRIGLKDKSASRLPNHHKGRINTLAIPPGGQFLVSGGNDGQLALWRQKRNGEWELFADLPNIERPVVQVQFDSTGKRLFVLFDRSHHIQCWNLNQLPKELRIGVFQE